MAFENVNTVSLKNSINSCISSINYSSSKQIINDIANNDIWSTSSRDKLSSLLQTLINTRYKDLEKKLQNYLTIADKIEKYQQLANSVSSSEALLESLETELSDASRVNLTYQSQGKQDTKEAIENKKKMDEILDKINSNTSDVNKNKSELTKLKNSIESLL